MSKRRNQVLNSSSEDEDDSDVELNKRAKPASSDSSTDGSDLDWTVDGGASAKQKKKVAPGGGASHETDRAERNSSNSPGDSWESGEDKSDNVNGDESDSDSLVQSSESGSVSPDESTSEADEFSDGLDSDLMGGPEDRARLDQMTEAEREQEIYRRLENRERLQERKRIYKQMKKERREKEKRERPEKARERSEKKRQNEEKELLNEYNRRSERKRKQTDTRKSEAIDQLKQNRLLQRERQENEVINEEPDSVQKKSPKKKRQYTVEGVFGSDSEEEFKHRLPLVTSGFGSGDEEIDYGLKRSLHHLPISSVEEINKIRMSRFRLDSWVHMPYFNEVVLGSYVRVGIGANEGKSIYRVAEVIEIVETPKVYNIINNPTNKGLRLKHGSQERVFKMQFVSNADITKSEFDKWRSAVNYAGLRLPTKLDIRKRLKLIEEAKAIILNNEEIELIVKEKEKFRKAPANYAMAKARLSAAKDKAEMEENFDEVHNLNERLQEINERAEILEKNRNRELTRISFINERNRMHNLEREETIKSEMAAGREDDPFTRRKCAPKLAPIALLHNVSMEGEPLVGVGTTPQKPTGLMLTPVPTSGFKGDPLGSPLDRTPELNGNDSFMNTPNAGSLDLSSAHDFDIPIDIPTGLCSSLPPMTLLTTPETNQGNLPRKNLNLSDYKKRKGLI